MVDRILAPPGPTSTLVDVGPIPERVARELAPLVDDPEAIREVYSRVKMETRSVVRRAGHQHQAGGFGRIYTPACRSGYAGNDEAPGQGVTGRPRAIWEPRPGVGHRRAQPRHFVQWRDRDENGSARL
jgi:hypothetical protein